VDWRFLAAGLALLPVAVFALWLGLLDTYSALGFQYRVLGFIFAVAGASTLAGSLSALVPKFRRTWVRPVGVLGGVSGVGIGAVLFLGELGDPRVGWLLLWGLVVVVCSVAVAGLVVATTRMDGDAGAPSIGSGMRLTRALASAGLSASLVWGVFEFWYSNAYVPGSLGAALAISTDFKEMSNGAGHRMVTADVHFKNSTGTKVEVISSLYKITAANTVVARASGTDDTPLFQEFRAADARSGAGAEALPAPAPITSASVSRDAGERAGRVIQFGKVIPDSWYFEPGEEYSTRVTAAVSKEAGDVLHLSLQVFAAKGVRLNLAPPDLEPYLVTYPVPNNGGLVAYVVSDWPISQLSHLRGLTRGDQAATIVVLLQSGQTADEYPALPALYVCIDRANRIDRQTARYGAQLCPANDHYQGKMREFYGLVSSSASYDLPLGQSVALPAQGASR
jgi:hypothetical protein